MEHRPGDSSGLYLVAATVGGCLRRVLRPRRDVNEDRIEWARRKGWKLSLSWPAAATPSSGRPSVVVTSWMRPHGEDEVGEASSNGPAAAKMLSKR